MARVGCAHMPCYLVRVWMPDRPGALGAVASRIGAVGGDLLAVDIIERDNGVAVDELAVELASPELVELLRSEVREVDGVRVEDVRRVASAPPDPHVSGLEAAGRLVAPRSIDELTEELAVLSRSELDGDWAVVVAEGCPVALASSGPAPAGEWLGAFVLGSAAVTAGQDLGPRDMAWGHMDLAGLTLVVGRRGRPVLARERRRLSVMARIADARWAELLGATGSTAQPAQRRDLARASRHLA